MDRREFFQLTTRMGALAAVGARTGTLAAWGAASGSGSGSEHELTASEFKADRRFVGVDSGRVAYMDRGTGPAALFLHGFPLNSFQWRGVIPRLSSHRRCIAPDFLALGFTEVGAGQSVTPGAQAAMLVQFLDKLGVKQVDIVANDSGGQAAQLLIARHPERVRSLLLTNCDTEPDSPPAAVLPVIELAQAGKYADQWLVPWLADKMLARSEKGLGGFCYADSSHPTDEAIEMYLGPLVASPARKALTNAYAIGLAPNPLAGIEGALKKCDIPVRIVWGTADTIFSQASPDYLEHLFSKSKGVRRVPGAKLFFPEEMPELIAAEALALWTGSKNGLEY